MKTLLTPALVWICFGLAVGAAGCGDFARPSDEEGPLSGIAGDGGIGGDDGTIKPGSQTGNEGGEGSTGIVVEGAEGTTGEGTEGATEGVEGFAEGPEGFAEGPEGVVEGPEGEWEGPEGEWEGPEGWVEGPEGSDERACHTDSDCALVMTGCCACGFPQDYVAVNVAYVEEVAAEACPWDADTGRGDIDCGACPPMLPQEIWPGCVEAQCEVLVNEICPQPPPNPECWVSGVDENGCEIWECGGICAGMPACPNGLPPKCKMDPSGCPVECEPCDDLPPAWDLACKDDSGCALVPVTCCSDAQRPIAAYEVERYMDWFNFELGCAAVDCAFPGPRPLYEVMCLPEGNGPWQCKMTMCEIVCPQPPPGPDCYYVGDDLAGCPMYECRTPCPVPPMPVCPAGTLPRCHFDQNGCQTNCECEGEEPVCEDIDCANGMLPPDSPMGACMCYQAPPDCSVAPIQNCWSVPGCMDCPNCFAAMCVPDPMTKCLNTGGLWEPANCPGCGACYCPNGYDVRNEECVPSWCPQLKCKMACSTGYARDMQGCPTCACAVP